MDPNSNTTTPSPIPTPAPQVNIPGGKKMKLNKTFFLVIGLIILTVALLIISLSGKVNTPFNDATEESSKSDAHTTLSISEEVRANTDGKYEVDVNISTGEDQVTGAQIELSYDPDALTDVEIIPGGFLESASILDQKVDEANGKITLTLGSSLESEPVEGDGIIAIISFSKANDSETNIEFLPETVVSAGGKNVLNETVSAVISTLPDSSNDINSPSEE